MQFWWGLAMAKRNYRAIFLSFEWASIRNRSQLAIMACRASDISSKGRGRVLYRLGIDEDQTIEPPTHPHEQRKISLPSIIVGRASGATL